MTITAAFPGIALPGLALPGYTVMTVSAATITNTLARLDDSPAAGVLVTGSRLPSSPWLSDGREVIDFEDAPTVTDNTGTWSLDLLPGDYRIREGANLWTIRVPSDGGSHQLRDVLLT